MQAKPSHLTGLWHQSVRTVAMASLITLTAMVCNQVEQVLSADPGGPADAVWSLMPPARPGVPNVQATDRVRTPVDAFILELLEPLGLSLARDAEPAALLRRAHLDLTGLPPTPQDVEAFLADPSDEAFHRVIDRLLESPHYGERWGRYWLDVAGYSDSRGILVGEVPRPTQYLYRDYVIRSFRDDKPYDRFLMEQLAGDELTDYYSAAQTLIDLPAEVVEGVIATGFLRNSADASRPDFTSIKHAPMYYYDTLNDSIAIIGSAMLGLTLQCAKCHDHKYDPIKQREFYELQSIFMSGYRPDQWVPEEHRYIEWATKVEQDRAEEHNRAVQASIDKLKSEKEQLQTQVSDRLFADRLTLLPDQIRDDVRQAIATDEKNRSEVQKYLAGKFLKELRPPREELIKLDVMLKEQCDKLDGAIRSEESRKRVFPKIRALYDMPGQPAARLLKRGDWRSPGDSVHPGVPAAIAAPLPFQHATIDRANSSGDASPQHKAAGQSAMPNQVAPQSSGRRLAFAHWITQPDHPLTARVMVNRIWQHHFQEGLVQTSDDFGSRGSPPTHPKLLDWLATEFVRRGWSVKEMHRLIMQSTVYRQSSRKASGSVHRVELATATDPTNRLLWHYPLKRLDAEAIRDSILAVSGSLDRSQFGPAIPLVTRPDGEVVPADGPGSVRRSIYLFAGRKVPVTMLHLFDQPMISVNCTRRGTSTLASQALDLLNSDFMVKQANQFADRLLGDHEPDRFGEADWDPSRTVHWGYQTCFGRMPGADELAESLTFVKDQADRYQGSGSADVRMAQRRAIADFGHMLLSSNEFVYVE